jgi:hypothetical protein
LNIKLSPKVTKIMTDHGNTQPFLHRLKFIGSPECPCRHGTQTVAHVIFHCKMLRNERAILKSSVLKVGKWPVSKSELTNTNLMQFIKYINSMDLEKITQSNEQM